MSRSIILTLLPILRASVSVPCTVAPLTIGALFQFPAVASSAMPLRLFGVRDTVVAGLLWTARHGDVATQRRALIAGMIIDAVDIGSAAVGVLEGTAELPAAEWLGGGAAFLLALGAIGLRAVGTGVALK